MAATDRITMTMRELDRLEVIEAVIEERLMPWRAVERLGISRRQVERLTSRYRSEGAAGLVSHRRARSSNHQLPVNLAAMRSGHVALGSGAKLSRPPGSRRFPPGITK
jgi:hypothetical protein